MAGGPDTPALAAAVAEAGGLGALGCGYLSPSDIEELIAAYRARSTRPVAINLFVREEVAADDAAAARVAPILDGIRRELALSSPPPRRCAAVVSRAARRRAARKAARLQLHLRTADARSSARLRAADILVMGTATQRATKRVALDRRSASTPSCAQGRKPAAIAAASRAFDVARSALTRSPSCRRACALPVVAAGGIMDARRIAASARARARPPSSSAPRS